MLLFAKPLLGWAVAASVLCVAASANAQTTAPVAAAAPPVAASSAPQGKGQRHPHGFKSLDTNKDGQISREEAKAHPKLGPNFDAIDTDKNGQLSKDELKAAKSAHRGQAREGMLQKLDTNKDGFISRDEAKGRRHLEQNFDAIDTNKDALLSADELKAFHAARWGKRPAAK